MIKKVVTCLLGITFIGSIVFNILAVYTINVCGQKEIKALLRSVVDNC